MSNNTLSLLGYYWDITGILLPFEVKEFNEFCRIVLPSMPRIPTRGMKMKVTTSLINAFDFFPSRLKCQLTTFGGSNLG